MDDVTFCDQLWEIIDPFLTAKQKVLVANSLADLLDEQGNEAYAETDWYVEHASQSVPDEEEE